MSTQRADWMIRTIKLSIRGQEYPLRYPYSPLMEDVIRGVCGGEYPFLPFLEEGPGAILDVGANIGCATVLFHALYPKAPILAFEPHPEAFGFLQSNTMTLPRVRAFNFGLFDRDCRARLYRGETSSVCSSLGASPFCSEGYDDVALRRASAVLAEEGFGLVGLLKIDTEGAEVPILRDLEEVLHRVLVVCAEYHSEADRREIDTLLSRQFMLFSGRAHRPHLGTVCYVAREVVAGRTDWNRMAIPRVRL